jgi:hypothetical protein
MRARGPQLFVDLNATRGELKNLTDTRRPEFESGKNPYGRGRSLRYIALGTVIFVLIVLVCFALIIEYGWPSSEYPHTP